MLERGGDDQEAQLKYMGKKTIGSYIYFGFKQWASKHWRIMRKSTADDGAWQYAYGVDHWNTIWADPAGQNYSDPPDA